MRFLDFSCDVLIPGVPSVGFGFFFCFSLPLICTLSALTSFQGLWTPKSFVCRDWFGERGELLRSLGKWCVSSDSEVNNSQEGVQCVQLDGLRVWKETTTPKQPRLKWWWPFFPPLYRTDCPRSSRGHKKHFLGSRNWRFCANYRSVLI